MPQKVKLVYKPKPAPAPEKRTRKVKVTYRPRNRTYTPTPRAIERQRAEERDLALYRTVLDLFWKNTPRDIQRLYEDDPDLCMQHFYEMLDSENYPADWKEAIRRVM